MIILNKPKPEAKYALNSIAPYTTIDLLLHSTELEMFSFSQNVLDKLQAEIDKINIKIEMWLRKQATFIYVYKNMDLKQSSKQSFNENVKIINDSHREIWNKNLYNKYTSTSSKINSKRPERKFWDSDRAFKNEWTIQKIEIPWIEEWDLRYNKENEVEINQILQFGYKESLFYNKDENKWYKEHMNNDSNWQKRDLNSEFVNWTI